MDTQNAGLSAQNAEFSAQNADLKCALLGGSGSQDLFVAMALWKFL